MHAVVADRADEQVGERAVSTSTDGEQVRRLRLLDQYAGRVALEHELLDRRASGLPNHIRHEPAKTLARLFLGIERLRVDHGYTRIARVPVNLAAPRHDGPNRPACSFGIANCPAQRFDGLLRAVDANDDHWPC